MTDKETKLLNMIESHGYEIDQSSIKSSGKEFDIHFSGKHLGYAFSAWMVLTGIRELTPWMNPSIACLTDYPEMTKQGDWSGMRDTSEVKLWVIFNTFVLPKLN